MMVLVFALVVAGLGAIALTMDRHSQHLPSALVYDCTNGLLRTVGVTALVTALIWMAQTIGYPRAILMGLGFVTLGTLCIVVAIACADKLGSR